MAEANSSPATQDSNLQHPHDPNPTNHPNPEPSVSTPIPSSLPIPTQPPPNPSSNPPVLPPAPPSIAYAPAPSAGVSPVVLPPALSFRPVAQFSTLPPQNPVFPNPSVQPPGVAAVAPSAAVVTGGPGSVPMPQTLLAYQVPPGGQPLNPALRPPYAPMANGFATIPVAVPQGTISLPGLPRYPSPYPIMIRPGFAPRPLGAIGMLPRPPIPGISGVRPIMPPIIRPVVVPSVTPAEKPQTTVYVGRIAPTVENEFILSVLQHCGPVKSWKRDQVLSNGTPRGFGFCEFESAEGLLRALRLLSKFNIDGQELVLNVNQATRDYLEKYVEKKTENFKKLKETEAVSAAKEDEGAPSDEKKDVPKPTSEEETQEGNDTENKESDNTNFGIVTDEDREGDREAMEKLTSMIEERLKNKPLPPPPALAPNDGTGNSTSEVPAAKSKEGDSDPDMKNDVTEEKNDDESVSDSKQATDSDRPGTNSPDRNRRHDRRSRERDRDRDLKREKDRELERYERETERERVRKEREQRRKIEEAERQYEEYLKDWEYRERDKEKQRQHEKEKEKERERKRKKEILYEEEDEDEDSRKRWRRGVFEEKRKRRLREKEDDLYDRQKEEEEIVEAKRREEEEKLKQQEQEALRSSSDNITDGAEKVVLVEESSAELKDEGATEKDNKGDPDCENSNGDTVLQNGSTNDESTTGSVTADGQHDGNVTTKKLGFGLVGSGKRTTVPSVFHEEDDEDAQKEKRMRPLVPIDYSTEELQIVQPNSASGATQSNLAAAAEFAKQITNAGSKDEKPERSKRSKDRNDDDSNRSRNETKVKSHNTEHGQEKAKSTDNKKLIDAKQLIDMIPRTKEELFSYQINWRIYDKHALHERMRPWISKKITEFLGEEEATLVDYIVSSTQEHVEAERMLQLLQSILDEEAEMFVLKMWRMLIFEIKKVETGLSTRTRT